MTDLNAVTPDMRPNAWEENLQEAMNDTSWYEVVAIQSGIPRLMMEEKEWFFNYLREQIILRGNESSMNSLHEIKNYFANLTRQGSHVSSTTQVALKKFLKNRQEQQQCSPYETITNGIRTYDGHPIPAYANRDLRGTYLESGDERMDTIAYYLSINLLNMDRFKRTGVLIPTVAQSGKMKTKMSLVSCPTDG